MKIYSVQLLSSHRDCEVEDEELVDRDFLDRLKNRPKPRHEAYSVELPEGATIIGVSEFGGVFQGSATLWYTLP